MWAANGAACTGTHIFDSQFLLDLLTQMVYLIAREPAIHLDLPAPVLVLEVT